MSNPFFRFKKFTIHQDRCAMKVGTDGVLLGAWVDVAHSDFVLDIGTGTGLIALMIAQRNCEAMIDAIDIDMDSCAQASENVENSIFRDRIQVIRQSFFDFFPEKKYDLIISNPPFFTNSLPSSDKKRNITRHNDSLPLKQLIEHAISILSENGRIAFILPAQISGELDFIIATHRLYEIRRTNVITIEGDRPKRFLIEMTKYNPEKPEAGDNILVLETKDHKRTSQYQSLTNDFYLNLTDYFVDPLLNVFGK